MRSLKFIGLIIFTLGLPIPALAWTIERSFDVASGGELDLDTDVGSIEVDTHSAETIEITVHVDGLDEDEIKVSFDHTGANLRVEGDAPRRSYSRKRVEFIVRVPTEYNVDLMTKGGSVSVEKLQGAVDVDTSGGSLSFGDIAGNIRAHTSGGTIEVDTADGEVNVSTSGGTIEVTDVTGSVDANTSGVSIYVARVGGSLEADTSGGSITIKNVAGSIDASTSGGSVSAEISNQPTDDIELSTSGGSVTVELEEGIAMSVNAKARRIRSDFPVDGQTSAKRRLVGDIGGGGPELDLHSSGGGISILRL